MKTVLLVFLNGLVAIGLMFLISILFLKPVIAQEKPPEEPPVEEEKPPEEPPKEEEKIVCDYDSEKVEITEVEEKYCMLERLERETLIVYSYYYL